MEKFSLDAASEAYKRRREELRRAEIALIAEREKVAALRRSLPADTPVPEDYAFTEAAGGTTRKVRLSELFGPARDTLLVYHFMWKPGDANPCPMCSMWCDGYDAVAPHLAQRLSLALIAKEDASRLRAFADSRGWRRLRVLSSGGTTFNRDFAMEDAAGDQLPGASVFVKGADGAPRHFYTVSAIMGDGHYRGMDLLSPVWNSLDLTAAGRGEWMPRLDYGGG